MSQDARGDASGITVETEQQDAAAGIRAELREAGSAGCEQAVKLAPLLFQQRCVEERAWSTGM